jgi:CheY-like chemotaxis protein
VKEPTDLTMASSSPAEPGDSEENNAPTILIIDDDPTARDLLKRALVRDGFNVQTAESGPEGLERARKLKPCAITLDVMMPGMDGWTVLSKLKADPELASIPVVMITIHDDKTIGYSLGATDYLTKPVNWDQLSRAFARFRKETWSPVALRVEDNPAKRESLMRRLMQEHWHVEVAQNDREALRCLSEVLPEVIVMNLMSPVMDGFEFVAELRKRPEWAALPIVVITASDLTDEERQRLGDDIKVVVQNGADSTDQVVGEMRRYMFHDSGTGI